MQSGRMTHTFNFFFKPIFPCYHVNGTSKPGIGIGWQFVTKL